MKKPKSYVALSVLASCLLYFAWTLGRPERTWIDWVVVALAGLAVLWNVVNLVLRFYRLGGGRSLWHVQRTLLFWVIGIFNTALIRPEEVGSWQHVVGWIMVILAVVDTVHLARLEWAGPSAAGAEKPE